MFSLSSVGISLISPTASSSSKSSAILGVFPRKYDRLCVFKPHTDLNSRPQERRNLLIFFSLSWGSMSWFTYIITTLFSFWVTTVALGDNGWQLIWIFSSICVALDLQRHVCLPKDKKSLLQNSQITPATLFVNKASRIIKTPSK